MRVEERCYQRHRRLPGKPKQKIIQPNIHAATGIKSYQVALAEQEHYGIAKPLSAGEQKVSFSQTLLGSTQGFEKYCDDY